MIDLAVGVIIGSAFTAIVNSLVTDIFTPLLSLLGGGTQYESRAYDTKTILPPDEAGGYSIYIPSSNAAVAIHG